MILQYHRQFSTNIKIKNIKVIPVLLTRPSALNKTEVDSSLIYFSYKPRKAVYDTMRVIILSQTLLDILLVYCVMLAFILLLLRYKE